MQIDLSKVHITFTQDDLDTLHDVIFNALGKDLTTEHIIKYWNDLPDNIKLSAMAWGMNDTPTRDEMYVYLQNKQKESYKGEIRIKDGINSIEAYLLVVYILDKYGVSFTEKHIGNIHIKYMNSELTINDDIKAAEVYKLITSLLNSLGVIYEGENMIIKIV